MCAWVRVKRRGQDGARVGEGRAKVDEDKERGENDGEIGRGRAQSASRSGALWM